MGIRLKLLANIKPIMKEHSHYFTRRETQRFDFNLVRHDWMCWYV